jgi:hypothetical protein
MNTPHTRKNIARQAMVIDPVALMDKIAEMQAEITHMRLAVEFAVKELQRINSGQSQHTLKARIELEELLKHTSNQ